MRQLWEIAPAHQLFVVDEKVVDPEDGGLRTRVAPESTIYVINADKSSYLSSCATPRPRRGLIAWF